MTRAHWAAGSAPAPRRPFVLVDRQALPAAFVGIGMAVTIGISFLLVIPIEPIYWVLTASSSAITPTPVPDAGEASGCRCSATA
jgi:hypothetical protein